MPYESHRIPWPSQVIILWPARRSWPKALFIFERFTVPLCLIVTMHGTFLQALRKKFIHLDSKS